MRPLLPSNKPKTTFSYKNTKGQPLRKVVCHMEEEPLPPPPYARQKPESVVSDATTTTALLHHNRPTNKAPQQRPTTPEIKAPVVLLGRSAGLLHSPSPSLLRKINNKTTSLRDSYLDPASPAQRTIASSTSSSTRTSNSTSITKQRPRTSTSTSGTLSSSNKSDIGGDW